MCLSDGRYWMLDVSKVYASGSNAWDTAVHDASEEYKHRMVGDEVTLRHLN